MLIYYAHCVLVRQPPPTHPPAMNSSSRGRLLRVRAMKRLDKRYTATTPSLGGAGKAIEGLSCVGRNVILGGLGDFLFNLSISYSFSFYGYCVSSCGIRSPCCCSYTYHGTITLFFYVSIYGRFDFISSNTTPTQRLSPLLYGLA